MKKTKTYIWDYEIAENWRPKNEKEWLWYLERKINYDDWKDLNLKIIKKFFPKLKKRLDPGKKMMLESFLKQYGNSYKFSKKIS